MIITPTNDWGWTLSSTDSQPTSTYGTSVTPVVGSYGSYATLISGASLTYDVWEIDLHFNSVFAAGTNRGCVCSLGIDQAGGTSFTSVVDLLVGSAGTHQSGGVMFRFPYRIKAGSSIGIAACTSASTTAIRAWCQVRGQPSNPSAVRAGSYIDAYGVTVATASGVSLTPGTASEGSWATLGTLTRPCWYVNFGYSIQNATMVLNRLHVDMSIGDASNKRMLLENAYALGTTSEDFYKHVGSFGPGRGAVGDVFYGRSQAASAPETGHTMAAYAVGG